MADFDTARGGWIITDAAIAQAVLRDAATWSSDHFDGPRPAEHDRWTSELVASDSGLGGLLEVAPQTLVAIDPPDHGRLRRVLRRAFAPAAIERLRPLVQDAVEQALPAIVLGAPVDVVAAFTRPVPFRVVATLLGVEPAGWDRLEALAHAASTDDTATEDQDALRRRLEAELGILRFFTERLAAPALAGEDPRVLPSLRSAVAAGELSVREAAGLCREVLVAGADSVGHHLSGALAVLAADPERAEALRVSVVGAEVEPLAAFVEERLAAAPPFTGFWRRATREAELLDGTRVPSDGLVLIDYAAVNATAMRHLSFGHGIHFCLGAALARLEATVALAALLGATRTITPAGPSVRLGSPQVNGHRRLPLRLVPV